MCLAILGLRYQDYARHVLVMVAYIRSSTSICQSLNDEQYESYSCLCDLSGVLVAVMLSGNGEYFTQGFNSARESNVWVRSCCLWPVLEKRTHLPGLRGNEP